MKMIVNSTAIGGVLRRLYAANPRDIQIYLNSTDPASATLVKATFNLPGIEERQSQVFSIQFLKKEFARRRKAKGIALANARSRVFWDAKSRTAIVWGETGNSYRLKISPDKIECECSDFADQMEEFKGKACCKHAYAFMHLLGIHSLSEYVHVGREVQQVLAQAPSGAIIASPETISYPKEIFRPETTLDLVVA
jgi:hypothetical protein